MRKSHNFQKLIRIPTIDLLIFLFFSRYRIMSLSLTSLILIYLLPFSDLNNFGSSDLFCGHPDSESIDSSPTRSTNYDHRDSPGDTPTKTFTTFLTLVLSRLKYFFLTWRPRFFVTIPLRISLSFVYPSFVLRVSFFSFFIKERRKRSKLQGYVTVDNRLELSLYDHYVFTINVLGSES